MLSRLRARYHYWLGLAHRSRGNRTGDRDVYESAIGELTHALILHPVLASAYFVRGLIYWRELNDFVRAVRDVTNALSLNPAHADVVLNRALASVYGQLRTTDEQIADFERYLEIGKSGYWKIEAHNQIRRLQGAAS